MRSPARPASSASETREIRTSRSTPRSRMSTCADAARACPSGRRRGSLPSRGPPAPPRPGPRSAPPPSASAPRASAARSPPASRPVPPAPPGPGQHRQRSSASMRNRSIIEKPLRSSLIARGSSARQRPAVRRGSRRSGPSQERTAWLKLTAGLARVEETLRSWPRARRWTPSTSSAAKTQISDRSRSRRTTRCEPVADRLRRCLFLTLWCRPLRK